MAHESGDSEAFGFGGTERQRDFLEDDLRLIVASNRGPLSFFEDESGRISPRRGSSPLSSFYDSLAEFPLTWVSGAVSAADRRAVDELSLEDGTLSHDLLPQAWRQLMVPSPRRVHHKFFNVICNPLLWFLFHRSWSPTFTPSIGAQEHDAWERGYRAVNEAFTEQIVSQPGDQRLVLLCRDYQLMLVPGTVREKNPDALIHYTLDTPWPWLSDLQIIPEEWRRELVSSLLSADIVTLASNADILAFEACVRDILGEQSVIESSGSELIIRAGNHLTKVGVSPPLVRQKQLEAIVSYGSTSRFVAQFESTVTEHTFVAVDRAEPHKNIVRSIVAFGELLRKRPELIGKVRFLLFLTPGPSHVSAYKRLNEEIRRSARRVNDSTSHENPVQVYLESNFYRAIAGLSVYDTLVSIPVVDGAARSVLDGSIINQKNGNLIVSDTSPLPDALRDRAYTVGYTDIEGISKAMSGAVDESAETREQNFSEITKALSLRSTESNARSTLERLLSTSNRG